MEQFTDPGAWQVVVCDDLEKVRMHAQPRAIDQSMPLSGCLDERISVQVAIKPPPTERMAPPFDVHLEVQCQGAVLQAHRVDPVPVAVPSWAVHDDHYDDDTPGLFPDPMTPLGEPQADGFVTMVPLRNPRWTSVWVDLIPQFAMTGPLRIRVAVGPRTGPTGGQPQLPHPVASFELPIEVTPGKPPPSPIVNTHWIHADGLALYYDTPMWSELHWTALDNAVAAAAEMGVTSLLTPVWTPPLDTAVGANRPTAQLLDIAYDGEGYSFGTKRLDRWIDMLVRHGITTVEVAHPFTQWGAKATPQIWVDTPRGREQRFGWHVPATDPAYRRFLIAVIPYLRGHLANARVNVLWHVSDEPSEQDLDSYRAARATIVDLLEGATVVDALSSPEFADLVQIPIVATDHVRDFEAAGVDHSWVYYCVGQSWRVSNRFIAQPMVGHRMLAVQLYAQQAKGFLHWGFNYYLSQYSQFFINPYTDTSAGGGFISGDPFVVYPGPGGSCRPSIRHRALAAMALDLRVMAWAEQLAGRDTVLDIVDPGRRCSGPDGYEAGWPEPHRWRRMRLDLDRLVRSRLAARR